MRRHAASRSRTGSGDDERWPGPFPTLESPRDTGLTLGSRRSSRRRTPPRWLPVLLTVAIIAAAGVSIAAMAPKTAKEARASVATVWQAIATSTPEPTATATEVDAPAPTPYFAAFRGKKLHLPLQPASVTVLCYHQSSYNDTYQMVSLLKVGSPSAAAAKAKKDKASKPSAVDVSASASSVASQTDSNGVWTGSALELWRAGRQGGRYTAIDCGAKPGTPVIAPIDGTVMEIRRYKLYGRYDDIEIDIKPDAWSDVDVILLHVTNTTVVEGQHVIGGMTPIAHVRRLSSLVPGLQLRTYSPDGGNHTHLQITKVPEPGQPWILGQDPPGMKRLSSD